MAVAALVVVLAGYAGPVEQAAAPPPPPVRAAVVAAAEQAQTPPPGPAWPATLYAPPATPAMVSLRYSAAREWIEVYDASGEMCAEYGRVKTRRCLPRWLKRSTIVLAARPAPTGMVL